MSQIISGSICGAIGGFTLGAILLLGGCLSSRLSDATFDPAAPKFPQVSGESLNKRKFEIPGQLDAPFNILMVAFLQKQQKDVDSWIPAAKALATDHANVEFYELPTINTGWTLVQGWIDGGMRSGIPVFASRERTITVYTDTDKFRSIAGIDGQDKIWVGVVDREGNVYWSTRGPATPETLMQLRETVNKIASPNASSLGGIRTSN